MKTHPHPRAIAQAGFTLTEALVSMVILFLVLAGALQIYIVYQNSWTVASLARQSSSESSMALEQMVYGVGTNGGLRAAKQDSVNVSYAGGGWRIDYNGTRLFRYLPVSREIVNEAGQVLCRNILTSTLTFQTNGCAFAVTVEETGGGRMTTNFMSSFVEFRN